MGGGAESAGDHWTDPHEVQSIAGSLICAIREVSPQRHHEHSAYEDQAEPQEAVNEQ